MITITRVLLAGAAILLTADDSFISESQVAERRGSNRRHELQPTAT